MFVTRFIVAAVLSFAGYYLGFLWGWTWPSILGALSAAGSLAAFAGSFLAAPIFAFSLFIPMLLTLPNIIIVQLGLILGLI